jgi:hypothetical protein
MRAELPFAWFIASSAQAPKVAHFGLGANTHQALQRQGSPDKLALTVDGNGRCSVSIYRTARERAGVSVRQRTDLREPPRMRNAVYVGAQTLAPPTGESAP